MKHPASTLLFILLSSLHLIAQATPPDASELIKKAIDYWRSDSSYTEVDMIIHRPDWQRKMSMRGWTRGDKDSLIIFTAPKKDAGNATLKLDRDMWIFTPRLNQVIKLPASMMSQSWMGSDFSYNDLAKSDQIIHQYTHRIINTEKNNGHTIYTIESIPKPNAPIVWGKEILRIRNDAILLEENFYDQDMKLVKKMLTTKIGPLGGKAFPLVMRMTNMEEKDHWTELSNKKAFFNITLPGYLFTLANLRNPRPWQAP